MSGFFSHAAIFMVPGMKQPSNYSTHSATEVIVAHAHNTTAHDLRWWALDRVAHVVFHDGLYSVQGTPEGARGRTAG